MVLEEKEAKEDPASTLLRHSRPSHCAIEDAKNHCIYIPWTKCGLEVQEFHRIGFSFEGVLPQQGRWYVCVCVWLVSTNEHHRTQRAERESERGER